MKTKSATTARRPVGHPRKSSRQPLDDKTVDRAFYDALVVKYRDQSRRVQALETANTVLIVAVVVSMVLSIVLLLHKALS